MSRKDLTLIEKISILDKIKAQPQSSLRDLEKLIGTSKSVLSRLKKNEKTIREQWEKLKDNKSAPVNRKRNREGKDPDVEKALNEWFSAVTERDVRVSGPMLQQKAEFFAEKIGHGNFKATEGWLSRWKDRNNIKFKRFHGEKSSANTNRADEWSLAKLQENIKKMPAPNGSLCYKCETLEESKKAIDGMKFSCCIDMASTDEEIDEDDDVQPVKITKIEAEKCIDQLKLYFKQNRKKNISTALLDVCADFINKQSLIP